MAAYTSTQTGNWAAASTWGGSGPPGDGDTAIIANGHTVTIAAGTSVTVGNSAAPATPAIQTAVATNGTGVLSVGVGATLTIKAKVIQGNANWVFNAGSTLNFLHASTKLAWQICDGTATNAILTFSGSAGSRITVQSTGAAHGYFTGISNNNAGKIQATFGQFTSMGDSVQAFIHNDCNFSGTSFATWFDDCLFTSCGQVDFSNNYLPAGATFRFRRSTYRTPADANGYAIRVLLGTGVHMGVIFDGFCWEGTVYHVAQAGGASGIVWTDYIGATVNNAQPPLDCSSAPPVGIATRMFLFNKVAAGGIPSNMMNGTITDPCSIRMNGANQHAMAFVLNADTTIDGLIAEFGSNDESGDQIQIVANPSVVRTLTVTHAIVPPCPDGTRGAGSFVNASLAGAASNVRFKGNHNTVALSAIGATPAGCLMVENTTAAVAMVQEYLDNLLYRETSGPGYAVYQDPSSVIPDGTFTNADYNNLYNVTGDAYQPADAKFATPSPPGTHDLTVNPQFFDKTRRFLSWGQSLNPALTTVQQVFDELFKRNDDSGFDSRFTVTAYLNYMRVGFGPTVFIAGHDGSLMGAAPRITLKTFAFLASTASTRALTASF